jgi:hypothetical protein
MAAQMLSPGASGTVSPAPRRVADIRPLDRADLPETAALFELVMGSGVRRSRPAMVGFFERTLFDNPWADPQFPSLVAIDERERIVGFIGAEVRRLRFGERPAHVVWSSHFVVDPAARRLAPGAFLLRRMLEGAQDATVTDNGSDEVRQMWVGLGGRVLHLKGINWVRLFQPCCGWLVRSTQPLVPLRPGTSSRLRPTIRRRGSLHMGCSMRCQRFRSA